MANIVISFGNTAKNIYLNNVNNILTVDKSYPNWQNAKITQKNEADPQNIIITDKVYLAVNDSIDNWKVISAEEAENLEKKRQAYIDEMLKKAKNII